MGRDEEIYSYWSSGQALIAGRIIYGRIPNDLRPRWGIGVLKQCLPLIPPIAEIANVCALADESVRWKEAHTAFSKIRTLTLQAEAISPSSVYHSLLHLAENTAKVIYNASDEPAPFDHDAGWWLVSCARSVVDKAQVPGLEECVWAAIVSVD